MRRMDLTDTHLPDASRTLVWCSHVLEHIADDRAALREVFRVLAPGGLLVLQVPIGGETTLEDPSVTDDESRLRTFRRRTTCGLYGRDLSDRIEAAGFSNT